MQTIKNLPVLISFLNRLLSLFSSMQVWIFWFFVINVNLAFCYLLHLVTKVLSKIHYVHIVWHNDKENLFHIQESQSACLIVTAVLHQSVEFHPFSVKQILVVYGVGKRAAYTQRLVANMLTSGGSVSESVCTWYHGDQFLVTVPTLGTDIRIRNRPTLGLQTNIRYLYQASITIRGRLAWYRIRF